MSVRANVMRTLIKVGVHKYATYANCLTLTERHEFD